MNELNDFVGMMANEIPVSYENMPDIELYMDQVLAFLSRRKLSAREGDNLTSAMINNYIKDSLVPRAAGKKYSREHLVYLTLVSRLKQVLSVKDMTTLLKNDMPSDGHEQYYENFRAVLGNAFDSLLCKNGNDAEALSSIATELAVTSYVNKIACEYIIDKIALQNAEQQDPPKQKPSKKSKAEPADAEIIRDNNL